MASVSSTSSQNTGGTAYGREILNLINSNKTTSAQIQDALMKGKDLTLEDQLAIQEALGNRTQKLGFLTNILKTLSEAAMNIIRNLR